MGNGRNPLQFLDIIAAVDSGEEDEDEEDEDDSLAGDLEDPGWMVGGASIPPPAPDADDPTVDAAFDALHRRAVARGAKHPRSSPDTDQPPRGSSSSTLIDIYDNPSIKDHLLFAVPCKVRTIFLSSTS